MIKKMSPELAAHLSGEPLPEGANAEKLRAEYMAREQAAHDEQQEQAEKPAPATKRGATAKAPASSKQTRTAAAKPAVTNEETNVTSTQLRPTK